MNDQRTALDYVLRVTFAVTLIFTVQAASWWLAHQLTWWTFALAMLGGTMAWATMKATRDVSRDRRRRKLLGRR